MNKVIKISGIVYTIGVVAFFGWHFYGKYEKAKTPPKITFQTLNQNALTYQSELSPSKVVTYVDTAMGDLNIQSNPVSEASTLKKKGFLTSSAEEKVIKLNGWTPSFIKRYHLSGVKINSISVLHSAKATNDPNIWVVETQEKDEYDFSNGNKPEYEETTVDWFLLKSSSGQWEINDFQNVSSKALKGGSLL